MKVSRLYYNLYHDRIFDKEVIAFMISFKRKYIDIYHSIMSSINTTLKTEPDISTGELVERYVKRWELKRPEVKEYKKYVQEIFEYCHVKYIKNNNV